MQTQLDQNIGDTKKAQPNKDRFHNISSNIPSMAENLDKKEYEEEEEELEMKAIPKGSQNFAFEEELNFKLIPNSHKQPENDDLPHSNSTTRNSQNNIDGHKQSVLDVLESVKDAKALMEMIERYQPKNKDISIGDIKASARTKLKRYKDCIYFGEIINSNRQGKGIMFYSDQRVYEGLWENNLKHGKGLEILTQGNRYEGQFLNGKPEGVGSFIWTNGEVYEGEWKNGLKHGSGMWKGMKGESYIGEWKNGKVDGYGVHTWRNGDRYEGELKGFLKHGHGAEKFINGDFYVGNYINGKPDGYGEYYWSNGCQYKGFFKNGLRHGKGIWKKAAENSDVYDGEWVNDKKCGNGTYVWASGNTYKGEYFNDMRHGYGEMYWVDGNYYKGAWEKGIQHGEGELMIPNKGIQKGLFENNVFAGEVNGDSKMNPFGGVTEKKAPNDIALNAISDSSRTILPDINKSRGRMSERSRSQAGAQRNPARVAGNSLEKQALKKELSAPRKQLNLSHSKDKSNGEFKKFKESNDLEISTQVRKKPNLPIWKPACKPSAPTKKDRSYYL